MDDMMRSVLKEALEQDLDQASQLLRANDAAGALPLVERAIAKLNMVYSASDAPDRAHGSAGPII